MRLQKVRLSTRLLARRHRYSRARCSAAAKAPESTETNSRYAYDGAGRRVLSQQGIKDQSELKAGTQVQRYEAGSHRGLRTAKRVGAQTTYYLYDTGRQLQAELNGQGQLQRQYLYVADMPLLVIDTPKGQVLSEAGASITQQALTALQDIGTAVQSWFSVDAGMGELTWLHTNHLGAPEVATNRQGQLVWQARYEAFGAALVNEGGVSEGQQKERPKFTLNLRKNCWRPKPKQQPIWRGTYASKCSTPPKKALTTLQTPSCKPNTTPAKE